MGIFRKTSASLAALCVSVAAQATTQWSSFRVEHQKISVRAIYPSQSSAILVSRLITGVKTALVTVEKKNLGSFESSFEVFFDDSPISHNGVATVIPRNFIWIYTVAPDNNDSIGVSKDYLQSTLNHEFGHMFYLQKRRGLFRFGQKLFGNLSSPLGSWPRWMQEGWASWVEERFSKKENLAYLNFLKRTYALATLESPSERLNSSMLEGNYSLNATSPGEIPYAFGYGMMEKLFNHIEPEKWAQNSAASLGISFRKIAQDSQLSMDEIFAQNEKEWRSVSLGSSDSAAKELYHEQNLYALSNRFVLASNDDGMRVVDFKIPSAPEIYLWRTNNWYLSQLIDVGEDNIVAAAFYTTPKTGRSPLPLKIALFKQNTQTHAFDWLCTSYESTSHSFVNFFRKNQKLYATLVSRLPQGQTSTPIQSILSIANRCNGFASPGELESQIFQTGFDTHTWHLGTKDHANFNLTNLVSPREEDASICQKVFSEKINWCASAIYSTETSRNPVLIAQTSSYKKLTYKSISVVTGAQETSLSDQGFFWIEKRWKQDLLKQVSLAELASKPTLSWTNLDDSKNFSNTENQKTIQSESYSPWSTLSPQYWMPQVLANNSGIVIGANAWFHDITKTYNGNLSLGYDTFSQRPYLNAYLQRKIDWSPLTKSIDIGVFYRRDANLSTKVDTTSSQIGVNGSQIFGASYSIASRFSLATRWTSINQIHQQFLIPSIALALRYREAPITNGLNVDHSRHRFGYLLSGRLSNINSYETYLETALSASWPLSWILHFEFGSTSTKNLPYSYFQWGGYFPLNFMQNTFLSRGFAPLSSPAINIGRAALTTGWKWSEQIRGIGWSRFSIEKISQDVFAESVTLERAYDAQNMKIGNQFHSSIGTELNFWIRSLFYVKSRAFLGLYQGFGIGGESRIAIGLASNLDI